MPKRGITIFTAISAIIFTGFYLWISGKLLNPTVLVKIGDTAIQAELADTQEKRVRGLSGKRSLAEDHGMLFVFDSPSTTSESEVALGKPGHHGIWMKDMKFPIDIIWARPVRSLARDKVASPEDLGEATSNGMGDLEIVDIAENVTPDTYPQVFRPQKPASYVLEVNVGFVGKNRIKIGDIFEFE